MSGPDIKELEGLKAMGKVLLRIVNNIKIEKEIIMMDFRVM